MKNVEMRSFVSNQGMPKWQKYHLYIHKALITFVNVDNRKNLKSPWRRGGGVPVCSVDCQWLGPGEGEMNNEEHQFPPYNPWGARL